MTWMPVGRPPSLMPDGTASTGQRLNMLNSAVSAVSVSVRRLPLTTISCFCQLAAGTSGHDTVGQMKASKSWNIGPSRSCHTAPASCMPRR